MNKNTVISKRFLELNGKFEKVTGKINQAKNSLIKNNFHSFEENIEEAMLIAEKTVLNLRETVGYCSKLNNNPLVYKRIIDKITSEVYDIKINYNNAYSGYEISLPATLAHYGNSSKTILEEPLNFELKKYSKTNKIEKFKKAFIIVVNEIPESLDKNSIRDNDNYEYKKIINTLAFWFLPDDSYKCVNFINCTKISDKPRTKIYIVPIENFEIFYKSHKTLLT